MLQGSAAAIIYLSHSSFFGLRVSIRSFLSIYFFKKQNGNRNCLRSRDLTQQATAASADRSDHISSEPLEKKRAKKQSSNSAQEQTKEKNRSQPTKRALDRKVSSKDGHSNRGSMNKKIFPSIFLVGVCFTCLFNNISSWCEIEISCFISSLLLTLFSLIIAILSLHFVFFSSCFRCYILFYLGLA